MKNKLTALGLVAAIYVLVILAPYWLSYPIAEQLPENARRYYDIGTDESAERSFSVNFFPSAIGIVLDQLLYVLMVITPIIIAVKLGKKWYSWENLLHFVSLIITVPLMLIGGGINHLMITGLNPFLALYIIPSVLYQLWYFIYGIKEFLSRVKIEGRP